MFYAGTGVPTTVDRMSVDIPFALHATFLLVPVAVAVVTLIVLVAGERRFGTVAQSRWGVATSSVLACSGTLIMTIPGYNPVQGSVLYLVGGILAGVGSGMMWVMWGQYYALIGQDKVETLAPVSAVMASVLVLLASAMEGIIGMVYIAGLVLCSGVCFAVCWRDVAQQEVSADHALAVDKQAMVRVQQHAVDHPMRVLRTMGRSGFGILIACLCVSVVGSLLPIQDEQAVLQISLVLSLVLLVVVGIVSTRGPRRMTIGFAYRWMCPVLVVVLVGIIVLPMETAGDFAYGVSLALRLALCLITQVYFAGFAAHGLATPTQSYGFGWIFVHLGDMLGVVVLLIFQAMGGAISPIDVACVLIVVMVVAAMYVVGGRDSFAAPDAEISEGIEELAGRTTGGTSAKPASRHADNVAVNPMMGVDVNNAAAGPMDREPGSAPVEPSSRRAGDAVTRPTSCVDGSAVTSPSTRSSVGETTSEGAVPNSASAVPESSERSAEASGHSDETSFDIRVAQLADEFGLTPRERDVFALLMRGRSVPYIRDELTVSRDTVATHVKHIYQKAGVHSRQELLDLGEE